VRNGYGEGRIVPADEALSLGMIDRIATLDETLARVMATPAPATRQNATGQELPLAAATPQELTDAHWQNATARALLELDL
jgi:enoyl-CoA hydratase/carnithine racemase